MFSNEAVCSKEFKKACLWFIRRKAGLGRVQSRATVRWGIEGGRGDTMSCSVNCSGVWRVTVGEWAAGNERGADLELVPPIFEDGVGKGIPVFHTYGEDILGPSTASALRWLKGGDQVQ